MAAWCRKHLLSPRILAPLVVVVAIIWLAGRGLPDGRLHVYFLDVGQGDAIFVRAPDGRQILVDGGPSPEALLNELGRVMPFWDRSLDLVVLTHPDLDHMAGLAPLLERYRVARVLDSYATTSAPAAGAPATVAWEAAMAQRRTPRVFAVPGMHLPVGALSLTVLHAAPPRPAGAAAIGNNDSTVLRLDYGRIGFLLTGDAEMEAEQAMLPRGQPPAGGLSLAADVLKVGHHGSAQSTAPFFLAAVAPRLAVIQVGAGNRFGHPDPALLARLAGVRVLRTDVNGQIEVITDGQRLWARADR